MVIALDQLFFWTFLTRPSVNIRAMIQLARSAPPPPFFELRPSITTTYATWKDGVVSRIHINSLGFRDRERAPERMSGVQRVIVAGDSVAFGLGVDDEEAFPQQLERQLSEAGRKDIEVWNAGVPGYAMADHLGFLRMRILALQPDVVVLQLNDNDSVTPVALTAPFMTLLRFSGLARWWLLWRFNAFEDSPLFSASFRAYVDECRRANISLILACHGIPKRNDAEVRGIAGSAIPLIEIKSAEYPTLAIEGHYTAEGNRRVAARLLPEVLAILDQRLGRSGT